MSTTSTEKKNRELLRTLYPEPKNKVHFDTFISYVKKLDTETDKDNKLKNPWMSNLSNDKLIELYKRVDAEGLVFDGRHITLQSTGISYDYIAYKNKMLLAYPKTIIDVQLVREGDDFGFEKISGRVEYHHKIKNPFGNSKVIGGYIVIKNSRGEFLTMLSEEDFEKHKAVAKTKYIWNSWPDEMRYKTLVKKGVKVHFDDIYDGMFKDEEGQYDLNQLLEESMEKWRGKGKKTNDPLTPEQEEWVKKVTMIDSEDELEMYLNLIQGDNRIMEDSFHSSLILKKQAELKSKK